MSDYAVRRSLSAVLLRPAGFAAVLVAWVVLVDPPVLLVGFLGAASVLLTVLRLPTDLICLRVDTHGIALARVRHRAPLVRVPWRSVREVVVVSGPTADPRIGIRLHPGAPLPAGVQGMIYDPERPDRVPPALVRQVPGLDRRALTAAVETYGARVVDGAL